MTNTLSRRISKLTAQQTRFHEKLNRVFSLRLATGSAIIVALIVLSTEFRSPWIMYTLVFLFLVFLRLVRTSQRIRRHQLRLTALQNFFDRQSRRLAGQPPSTQQPRTPTNELAIDLDLFGPHSLLSQIDETLTDDGRNLLADMMTHPHLDRAVIENRQKLIAQLSLRAAGFLRRWTVIAHADLDERPTPFSKNILTTPLIEPGFHRTHFILWSLFAVYLIAFGIAYISSLPLPIGALWLIYFFYSMFALGKTSEAFNRIQTLGREGARLAPLFKHLEKMEPGLMATYLPKLKANPLSRSLKKIDQLTSLLSVQTHPLVSVLVNGFIPWSCFFVSRAEKLREQLTLRWPPLMDEFNQFEVLSSLAFLHRYQTQTFPKFVSPSEFSATGMRHPLISKDKNVPNDFVLPKSSRLVLITGSNMSGKSTFLRTLGINQTLAMMGAPVWAKTMNTPMAKPLTCIRVSDSIRDGVSYFYAETLRLKSLLDETNESSLFLIDEIFRGTNNRERLIGSRSVVSALIQKQGLGFVTTHDLELTLLEGTHSELTNWHFSDDLDASGLRFSYRIHKGPCPTTNALKIMKSLGLPIDI